jgi:putative transposase
LATLTCMRKPYPTDLSDAEWACIEPHLLPTATEPPEGPGCTPYVRSLTPSSTSRAQWLCLALLLAHEFPPWKKLSTTTTSELGASTVPGSRCTPPFARAITNPSQKRSSTQCAGIVDSQSVKTITWVGGEDRGYDGGKKVKGRKRHLLVDTEGLVLKANVHAANECHRPGGDQAAARWC